MKTFREYLAEAKNIKLEAKLYDLYDLIFECGELADKLGEKELEKILDSMNKQYDSIVKLKKLKF